MGRSLRGQRNTAAARQTRPRQTSQRRSRQRQHRHHTRRPHHHERPRPQIGNPFHPRQRTRLRSRTLHPSQCPSQRRPRLLHPRRFPQPPGRKMGFRIPHRHQPDLRQSHLPPPRLQPLRIHPAHCKLISRRLRNPPHLRLVSPF